MFSWNMSFNWTTKHPIRTEIDLKDSALVLGGGWCYDHELRRNEMWAHLSVPKDWKQKRPLTLVCTLMTINWIKKISKCILLKVFSCCFLGWLVELCCSLFLGDESKASACGATYHTHEQRVHLTKSPWQVLTLAKQFGWASTALGTPSSKSLT